MNIIKKTNINWSWVAVIAIILALSIAMALSLRANLIKLPGVSYGMSFVNIGDFSVDEELVGASHNVYVAKIIKQTEYVVLDGIPFTKYEAEVKYNIKGDIVGRITVLHQGGYKNGRLNLVNGAQDESNNMGLLKEGSTYLLASRHWKEQDMHFLILHPNSRLLISNNPNFEYQYGKDDKVDNRIRGLQEAYKKEVLPQADIIHSKDFNSYKRLLGQSVNGK